MIQQNNDTTSLGGTASMQNFSIEMNESMFTMLTKNVYTDTVLAVMREWSTNAIDSCKAAGLPVKYKVHLPTLLNPSFSVRDYGTGLSDDEVKGLFSVLGASTKRESNEYNGTFGIGRMSGLAYSDSFTVDSYMNKHKYSYLVSTDSGIPQVISLGSVPTDEPNGLSLAVPVKPSDLSQFARKAVELYRFFDEQPETSQPLDYTRYQKTIEGKGWYIESSNVVDRYTNKLAVIMGNVAYIVECSHLKPELSKIINRASLRLEAPLGSVSITPGRESLSIDGPTLTYLNNRIADVITEIHASIDDKLDALKSGWERATKFNSIFDSLPYNLRKSKKYTPKEEESAYFAKNDGSKWERSGTYLIPGVMGNYGLTSSVYDSYRVTPKTPEGLNIKIITGTVIIIGDIRTNIKDVVVQYRSKTSTQTKFIVIRPQKWNSKQVSEFVSKAKKYLEAIGCEDYLLASEQLKDIPQSTSSSAASTARTATNFSPMVFNRTSKEIKVSRGVMLSQYDHTKIKTFYYVEMSSYDIKSMSKDRLSIYLRFVELYRKQTKDLHSFRIVGVPKTALPNIKGDSRFVPLEGSLTDLQDKVTIVDRSEVDKLKSTVGGWASLDEDLGLNDISSTPKELLEYVQTIKEFNKKYPKTHYTIPVHGINTIFSCKEILPDVKYRVEDIKEQYPSLLQMIGHDRVVPSEVIDRYLELEQFKKDNECNIPI